MKVIWRQKDKDWEIAFGKSYRDEDQLQSLLAEFPTMIHFEDVSEDIPQPRVMFKEVGLLGSRSGDIIGVQSRCEGTSQTDVESIARQPELDIFGVH